MTSINRSAAEIAVLLVLTIGCWYISDMQYSHKDVTSANIDSYMESHTWKPFITQNFSTSYSVIILIGTLVVISKITATHVYKSYTSSYVFAAIICENYSFAMYFLISLVTGSYVTSLLQSILGYPSPDLMNRCFVDKHPSDYRNRQIYRDYVVATNNIFTPTICHNFIINNSGNMSIVGTRFDCPIKYECVKIRETDVYQP